MKKVINDVQELWGIMPEWFKSHVHEMDGDLPTASIAALEAELPTGPVIGANLVPVCHGQGLISRACSIAKRNGFTLGPKFKFVLPE